MISFSYIHVSYVSFNVFHTTYFSYIIYFYILYTLHIFHILNIILYVSLVFIGKAMLTLKVLGINNLLQLDFLFLLLHEKLILILKQLGTLNYYGE